MKRQKTRPRLAAAFLVVCFATHINCVAQLLPQEVHVSSHHGNTGVAIERHGKKLVVYGDPAGEWPKADMVLFTHFRRDLIWAGRDLVNSGAVAVVPQEQLKFFTRGDSLWQDIARRQFREHSNRTTKIAMPLGKNFRTVKDGDIISWQGIEIKVIRTTGNTHGAVSYLTTIEGKKIAFVGDMIFGDGQIFDLYSYQDSLKGGIDGNHGYAVRLGHLIKSLHRIAQEKPDIVIPARGEMITDPEAAFSKLRDRIERLYQNYLSITAQRWNHTDRMIALSNHVLGQPAVVDWMPFAETIKNNPPAWYKHMNCGKIIISEDSAAFLIDCGTKKDFDEVMKLKKAGRIKSVDGIFVTHYHYDHTDFVSHAARTFACKVYVTNELKGILENPGAYHMPSMTSEGIPGLTIMDENAVMKWKEFKLTFSFFPGQTLYHDGLLMEKDNGEAIFFTGDSFSPAGIDDYCFQNRNVLAANAGYLLCLDILKKLPAHTLLANQHLIPLFRFSQEQIDYMVANIHQRMEIMKELMPWDNVNYGTDDQWTWIYPYGQEAKPGETISCQVRITNYSNQSKTFQVNPVIPKGFRLLDETTKSITLEPGKEGVVLFRMKVPKKAAPGVALFLADISFDNWHLREWTESFVDVTSP